MGAARCALSRQFGNRFGGGAEGFTDPLLVDLDLYNSLIFRLEDSEIFRSHLSFIRATQSEVSRARP